MGYLGKISAVVSVNTGDFSSKINRLKGDVNSFSASTQRSLADAARASSKSFGSIYTEVQKLERALQAASRLEFNGLKGFNGRSLSQAAEQMRTIASIASQLSSPLGKVVQSIEQMDPAIQRHLLAPMLSAQKAVEGLQTKAKNGGVVLDSSFRAAESRLERLTTAANRAKEAMAAASGIGGGGGFRFQQPAAFQELQRGAGLYSAASALPENRVTPNLVKLLNEQKAAADAATNASVAFSAKPSQENADSLKATVGNLEMVNDSLKRLLNSYDQIDARAEKIRKDLSAADAARESRAAALLSMQQQYQQALTGEAQTIDQLRSRYNSLVSSTARLPAANRATAGAGMAGDVSIVQGILEKGDATQLVAGNQALARAEAVVATQAKDVADAEKQAAQAKKDAADATEKLAKQTATLASLEARRMQIATGEAQTVDQLRTKYDSLLSRLEKLPAQYRAAANAAVAADAQMVATVVAEGTDADVGAVKGEVANLEQIIAGFEDTAGKAKEATKAADEFRDSLSKIADAIGDPSEPIDQLRKAVQEANAEIAKMKPGAAKAATEAAMRGLKSQIAGAPDDAEALRLAGVARGIGGQASTINAAPKSKTAEEIFGKDLGSAGRQADGLKDKIIALQGQFEKLPKATQAGFGKLVTNLRNDYMALGNNPSAAAVKKLEKDYEAAERAVKRFNQAAAFKGTFASFLKDTSFKYFEAQLGAVQSRMAEIGATAGGPVAKAIKKYRDELAQAAKAGQLGTDATRKQMKARVEEIAQAAIAEGKFNKAQAKAFVGGVMRSGDIGRMGADKVGLALNQAAFAIDDFMSSTGGIEMKIRAISNNLSQLGFVIGGTKGLFAALGVTIAAQATIALMKFSAGGVTSEDRAKALNEAISKQKTLVEELAQAYSGLSKEMSLSAASDAGVRGASSLGAVGAANQANRIGRLTGVNQQIVEERAMQAAIQKLIEAVTNVGVMIAKQQQLRLSQARTTVEESKARVGVAADRDELQLLRGRRRATAESLNRSFVTRALETVGVPATFNRNAASAAKELEAIEAAIRAIEDAIVQEADNAAYAIVAASTEGRGKIAYAQSQLADAIAAGVPGVLKFQSSLDRLSFDMSAAMAAMIEAAKEESPERRKKLTEQAQADMDAVNRRAAAAANQVGQFRARAAFAAPLASEILSQLDKSSGSAVARANLVGAANREQTARGMFDIQQANVAQAASEVTRIKAAGDTRVREAGKAAEEAFNNMRFIEKNASKLGQKEVDKARALFADAEAAETREKAAAARDNKAAEANLAAAEAARDKAQADVEAAAAASRAAAAFEQAAIDISQFLGRTRKIAEGAVGAAEQRADMAQRAFTDRPNEANRQARDAAERSLIDAREKEATLRASIDARTRELASDKDVLSATNIIADREQAIRELQQAAAAGGAAIDPREIETLQNDITAARAERERLVFEGTANERAAMDQFAADEAKKRLAEERRMELENPAFGREARAAERERVRQGREDAMTSRERQRLDAMRGAENMAAAAGALGTQAERKAFVQEYFNNRRKEILQSGPLGQAADERFNAMSPGARRIGIEASDVTTSEGSRELNRLLRGDDANKDANFAEMQRQTELLSDIAEAVKANTGIGVIN